jgi:hypothetical protein
MHQVWSSKVLKASGGVEKGRGREKAAAVELAKHRRSFLIAFEVILPSGPPIVCPLLLIEKNTVYFTTPLEVPVPRKMSSVGPDAIESELGFSICSEGEEGGERAER